MKVEVPGKLESSFFLKDSWTNGSKNLIKYERTSNLLINPSRLTLGEVVVAILATTLGLEPTSSNNLLTNSQKN